MKRYIYILCAVLMGVFASCSKSEMGGETPQFNQVTLKVATDEGLQTRANATDVNHYAIEVYTDASYNTKANVFSDGTTNRAANGIGVFSMTLDRTKAYYCLLWADKDGTSSVYIITSLKEVTLTGKAVEAWHGITTIAAGTEALLTATLTRAVSKITLIESGNLGASATLKLSFAQPTKFNVATKTASENSARPEEVITISANVTGTPTAPVVLNPNNDIFVLSSVATADLIDLTFQYNEENPFIVSQAPLKANFNTNINGHYTSAKSTNFTVTADDVWETPDNNVLSTKAKVGDFYYKDKTFSSTYTDDSQNPCIGIVFVVNADGKTGKIVSLDEVKNTQWSTENIKTNASSDTDGAANTATISALNTYTATVYPAFGWCDTKNTPSTAGIHWYLPARAELHQLYAAMSGLKWVASGAGAGEVNDWINRSDGMPYNANYAAARTAFNNKFITARGTSMDLTGSYYHSSSEDYQPAANNVRFSDGYACMTEYKKSLNIVRAVSVF